MKSSTRISVGFFFQCSFFNNFWGRLNYLFEARNSINELVGINLKIMPDNDAGTALRNMLVKICGNTDLSSRAEEQTFTVISNTIGAQQPADSARAAVKLARDRGFVSATIQESSENAEKVRDITSVIESITFQTNILALNVAVEALRSGKEGHGFAVVAAEVLALAQRSANASKDIKILTEQTGEQIQSGVSVAVSKMEGMMQNNTRWSKSPFQPRTLCLSRHIS